jgi:Mg-chelatase subunit ChlD
MILNRVRRAFENLVSLLTVKRTEARAPERGVYAASTPESITPRRLQRLSAVLLVVLVVSLASAQEAVDNVVIVLDASGSMAGRLPGSNMDKMTAAKAALKQVLKSVPESTHIGLLVFSARGVETDWIYPLGPRDDARLMQAIDRPQPGGGTPLGAYLKKGSDRLLQERAKQFGYGTFRLLVVTDGEAGDQELVERYTPEVIARGIKVDVIGVAMNQRHTLATRVHSYRSANDPASLQRAVAEVFGEIGGSGNDVATSAEAFAELKPIPAAVAQAMIQALSASGNQPIGEQPRSKPPPVPNAGAQMPPANSPPPLVAPASARSVVLPVLFGLSCFGIASLFILLLIIKAIKKSRR